ncbi:MAG: protein kinase [Chloroflexi bacterium]|nr:protein kinase [Chloroflexota bacterium]
MALQIGQNLGPYRILEQLGAGGMASVFKAYHARLDRYVAIKVMHQSFMEDPTFHARFEREAQIVARLEHPNIVPIFDFSEHERQPYLVMKYVEGRTLKTLMSAGALPMGEITRIMTAIADALTYAHKQGVLHRDIKPSNIIIAPDGTPYLTDFGLARIAQAGASTMSADVMLGTPQYISPEQAKGVKELDARTDVYSFGVVLYEMVCGRVPFNADTPYATVHDHIYSPLPLPSKINPDIAPAVETVLLKALAKDPQDRYNTPTELMAAFREAVAAASMGAFRPDRASAGAVHEARKDAAPADIIPSPKPEKPKMGMPPLNMPVPPAPRPPLRVPSVEDNLEQMADRIEQGAERWAKRAEEEVERWANQMERRANRLGTTDDSGRFTFEINTNDDSWDEDDQKAMELELATDEEGIRRRVEQRIKDRRDFRSHLLSFTLFNAFLWIIFALTGADFPWPMFVSFGWGSGLVAHMLNIRFTNDRNRDKRDHDVENMMLARHGSDWRGSAGESEWRQVREMVYKQHRKRNNFNIHASIYACINALLWMLFAFSGADFPWPLFVTGGWGIGLFFHGVSVYTQSAKQAAAQEEHIAREIERERQRLQGTQAQKRKNENISPPPVRLNSEGELTESFVEELDEQQKKNRL